jgi:N-acetylmuramoyl-L-alanine amidase
MKSMFAQSLVLFWLMVVLSPCSAAIASEQSDFYAAERCYAQLLKNESAQKYRDRWLRCIQRFVDVHKKNPQGPWAAAALFKAGEMYERLSRISFSKSDRQEALNLFDRVERQYPQSRYVPKARAAREAMTISTAPAKTASSGQRTAFDWYKEAHSAYRRLQEHPAQKSQRDQWFKSIDAYRKAYQSDPGGSLAAAALFGMAECYQELYRHSWLEDDRTQSRKSFVDVVHQFPDSPYAQKARNALGPDYDIASEQSRTDAVARAIAESVATPPQEAVNVPPNGATQGPSVVEGLRFWSNPRYTRIVIDANQDTAFTYRELREDPDIGKPPRIYIDIHGSRLSRDLQKVIPINDDLLRDARAGQYSAETVRVVVDIKSFKTYKIFSLKNPFRIVLDVWGIETDTAAPAPPVIDGKPQQLMPGAIAKQLALGIRRVVIDPGHGGRDFGAPGAIKGVHEKHITLQIAKRLAPMVRAELNCEVFLTRNDDTYLSLEERTAIANTKNADLFISIHTNASHNRNAYGLETYILNLATDDEAIRVAARENATSTKNISDLDSILKDLMQNAKVSESTRLASFVQESMVSQLKHNYSALRSKGVKQAPFYVLLGAEMPSILIETGFISNPAECKRLIDTAYQERLCRGIIAGITHYAKEIKPVAFQP